MYRVRTVWYIPCMQKGTKQSDSARAAIALKMRERWAKLSKEERSVLMKARASKRSKDEAIH